MRKEKLFCLSALVCLGLYSSIPTVVSAQYSNSENISEFKENASVDDIVNQLSEMYPQFDINEIRTAVIQAYNGQAMTLPKDKSVIGYGERSWQGVTTGQLAFAINTAIAIASGGGIANLASKLSSSALRRVRYSIQSTLAQYGASWVGQSVIASALYALDPGQLIADWFDRHDTVPNNGRINLW